MLPKTERLTKEDFKDVRPKIFFRGVFFDIGIIPAHKTKFACIISKKKIPTAVKRNSVRRKITAILEREKPTIQAHYFFYIKKEAEKEEYETLHKEIMTAFATLN